MKVMLDTNILISAFVFNSKIMNDLIEAISQKYKIQLASSSVEELKRVTKIKFKIDERNVIKFLDRFPYELVHSPNDIEEKLFDIRDEDDYIILHTAVLGDADIFITGDKDFEDVKINKPKIMSASEFIRIYG